MARAAEVAEQTVYNYFPTKEQVTDREEQVQDRLCDLIRSRQSGVTPAAAIRGFVLEAVAGIRTIPPEIWRGELGCLAAISPALGRRRNIPQMKIGCNLTAQVGLTRSVRLPPAATSRR